MIEFLTANWLWIVLVGAFVWIQTRGGGCGMHGSYGHGDGADSHEHDDQPPAMSHPTP